MSERRNLKQKTKTTLRAMLSSSSPSPSTPLSSPFRIDTPSPISQQQQQQQQPQLICLDAHQTQLVLEAAREQLITLGCPSVLMEDNSIVVRFHFRT